MKIAIKVPYSNRRLLFFEFKIKSVLRDNAFENIRKSNRSAQKIFCIGRNKTGTTSIEKALSDFGYKMGDQAAGELLIHDYGKRNWKPIIDFCGTAEAFQDIPFSLPFTWLVLHTYFPKSRFILTVRNAEDWYRSLISFHAKMFTDGVRIPVKEDLQQAEYRYKGYLWEANRIVSSTPENDLYNKNSLIENYNRRNESIRQYFKNNPLFLEIDVSKKDSYKSLCDFLGREPLYDKFPHLNKTSPKTK